MAHPVDVVVVGAGIVGLAHAWAAARRGLRVVVLERDAAAQGASVRNFGMVWPIGQPPGPALERARLSREYWLELGREGVLHVEPCGSLHLAYHDDEMAVLEEFRGRHGERFGVELLAPDATARRCPAVRPEGLLGSLWSPDELCVDPRAALASIPGFLAARYGVEFHWNTPAVGIDPPAVRSADGRSWQAGRILVCSGVDFQTLFPAAFAGSGIRRCKLQMMRTAMQPGGWRLGPHVAGGLTLCHYSSFLDCPSLPALRRRFEAELPRYLQLGIHVMASQNHPGEVVIGDSHEYDADVSPFDKAEIDELILGYLGRMVRLPDPAIAQRWHGIYAKHPTLPLFVAGPAPGVHILVAPGGAGMTLSFGQAEEWWRSA